MKIRKLACVIIFVIDWHPHSAWSTKHLQISWNYTSEDKQVKASGPQLSKISFRPPSLSCNQAVSNHRLSSLQEAKYNRPKQRQRHDNERTTAERSVSVVLFKSPWERRKVLWAWSIVVIYYICLFKLFKDIFNHFIGPLLVLVWTCFCFWAAAIRHGRDLTRCWKHPSQVLIDVDMIASHSCCKGESPVHLKSP